MTGPVGAGAGAGGAGAAMAGGAVGDEAGVVSTTNVSLVPDWTKRRSQQEPQAAAAGGAAPRV
jgi:hypothetical protein